MLNRQPVRYKEKRHGLRRTSLLPRRCVTYIVGEKLTRTETKSTP